MTIVIINILLISFILPLILILLNSTIAKKNTQDREKPSAFECGFDPKRSARIPFSLRFFLIAVIFLIFDVEITLILPTPIILPAININSILTLFSFFIFILIAGLFLE